MVIFCKIKHCLTFKAKFLRNRRINFVKRGIKNDRTFTVFFQKQSIFSNSLECANHLSYPFLKCLFDLNTSNFYLIILFCHVAPEYGHFTK